MTEQEALLVLNAVPDLGAVRIRKLVAFFGSALEVLQASVDELRISGYFRRILPKIYSTFLKTNSCKTNII